MKFQFLIILIPSYSEVCRSSWSWLSKLNSACVNVFNLPFLLNMQMNCSNTNVSLKLCRYSVFKIS